MALSLPIAIALVRSAGARLGVGARTIDIATLALALHPRGAYMIALGWTEPWLVLAAAAFVWCAARPCGAAVRAIAFMLMVALKQYMVAPLLIYALMVRRWRPLAIGAAAAGATVVPFLLSAWRPTVEGILFPLRGHMGFRPDSISISAFVYHLADATPPTWLATVVQLAVGGAAYVGLRRDGLTGLLLACAIALFASFLVGTQAFVNYYYFVSALLVCGAVASAGRQVAA
jgi:hypothetical protein